jgi:hypothetical protein
VTIFQIRLQTLIKLVGQAKYPLVKTLKNKRFRPFCLCLPDVMFANRGSKNSLFSVFDFLSNLDCGQWYKFWICQSHPVTLRKRRSCPWVNTLCRRGIHWMTLVDPKFISLTTIQVVKKLKNKRFRPFCLCPPDVMFVTRWSKNSLFFVRSDYRRWWSLSVKRNIRQFDYNYSLFVDFYRDFNKGRHAAICRRFKRVKSPVRIITWPSVIVT